MAEIRDKTLFLTGGCGFIGTSIALDLIEHNKIFIYDNERRNAMQYTCLPGHPNLTFIHGDVLDREHLQSSIPDDVDIIVHLAAVTGASSYARFPVETLRTNVIGTANVLECAKDRPLGKFINFSSSEVYGKEAEDKAEDSSIVLEPIQDLRWSYAISKIAAESFTASYSKMHSLPAITIRPCNVYGPYQVGESAIHNMISKALKNEPVIIYGDGEQTRSWCYIDDFLEAFRQILTSDIEAETFNIGNYEEYYSINYLARKIIELTSSSSPTVYEPIGYAEVYHRRPDMKKISSYTTFCPRYSLESGLVRTIEWFKQMCT